MSIGYWDQSYPPSIYAPVVPTPTIATLTPSTLSAAAAAATVTVTGTGFVPTSVVRVGVQAQATTYVSATQLTISCDPTVAGTLQFTVANGVKVSNQVAMTVTA